MASVPERRRRRSTGVAAAVAATLVASVLTPTPVAAADTYGDSMTVTFGTNEHSKIPVDLTLPVPGDGRRVAKVTFRWQQTTPTYQGGSTGSFAVETPHCVADAACEVHAVVPTARMHNSVITPVSVVVSDGTTTIGSTSRSVKINNPKPTVAFTAPGSYDTFWDEQVTLTADATPGSGGVPIKRVRFYVNPRSEEAFPFRSDDTAPYSVTVPASEIAEPTHGGTLYAVAEDVEGNLSRYSSESPQPFLRYVRVGPPPVVSWWSPAADGRPAGGMATTSFVHWRTSLPDTAPPDEGTPEWPYIERIEIYRDGALLSDKRYDERSTWGDDFGDGKKVRTVESYLSWTATNGMTPGEHTVRLRVTTSYGSVASATRTFIVTDGVRFGRVMSGDRVVEDGHIVTAGRWVPLRFFVAGKVPGSALEYSEILQGDVSVSGAQHCQLQRWWNCPESATVRADWSVPAEPGTYTLTFAARESQDHDPSSITRTFRVQPAGAIRAGVSADSVRTGEQVTVRGQVVRTDTGRGVRGVPVTLQWRRAGTDRWTAVASRTSGLRGRVRASVVRRTTGVYRWASPGVPGTLGSSRSRTMKVVVR
jgi:hypothetical protein